MHYLVAASKVFNLVLFSLLFGVASCVGVSAEAQTADPTAFGKTLVSSHDFSAEQLAAFAAHAKKNLRPSGEPLGEMAEWSTKEMEVKNSASPYTIVVTVKGRAVIDGDISMMWASGWNLADNSNRLVPMPGLSRPGAKAGELVTIVASSPTSFKENRTVAPLVGLARASNFQFESVNVQIWQGFGKSSTRSYLMPFTGTLLGLVMLGVWFWSRRR
jgi:hypothetical protein